MTSRQGGVSLAPWDRMNLGDHVGDLPRHVQANRQQLAACTATKPTFLRQVHGHDVVQLQPSTPDGLTADASWTWHAGLSCTIMVADCLPVLLCDRAGRWVAAAHAGWRGLTNFPRISDFLQPAGQQAQGVLEALFSNLAGAGVDVSQVLAWLGPCIGPQAFEVGPEVKAALDDGTMASQTMFRASANGKFMANLAGLARLRLQALGVSGIYGNDGSLPWCTVSRPEHFFSHRRDSTRLGHTGRMAACIWLGR
jgi:copper oxidase (laccase) domain-containing protein